MKKFFSLVLALVMALSLTTVAWGASANPCTDDPCNHEAKIGDTHYDTLSEALKAVVSDDTVTLLKDITISADWDCRKNGAKITVPVTIDGNSKTLKLTGNVDDKNWDTVLRFEGETATVKNLTIDVSDATGVQRSISSKYSVVVENCTFIGNGTSAKRAVIYGEGAKDAVANVTATITGCTFTNWSYGVSDNQSGKDAKSVSITGSTFNDASVLVSAKDTVAFTGNTVDDGYVNISSYAATNELSVTATGNTLDAGVYGQYNQIKAKTIEAQDGFLTPVAEVNGKYYLTLQSATNAATDGDTVVILPNALNSSETFEKKDGVDYQLPDGMEIADNGNGDFVVVEEAANTSSASGLYAKATSKGATLQKNITLNFFKAVDNKVDKKTGEYVADGNVAYYMIDGVLTKYAEVYTLADADMVIYTDETCKNVYAYLDVVNPFYVGDGVVTKNFGTACGQYSNDETNGFDDEATYYTAFNTLYVGVEAGAAYQEQLLVNGELVGVNVANIPVNAHKAVYTRDAKSEITSIKCSACGLAAVEAANYAVLPVNPVMVNEQVAPLWYWPAVVTTPSTDKVTSAETFDAGIAMYVGMSVMAAAGSAVVIGKKKD